MKKFLAGIAAAAIITVPMTSFALESMSKGALKKATGQAGVSIALDNIVIYQKSMPTTTYWDIDGMSTGLGTLGSTAAHGIEIKHQEDAEKLITIGAVLDGVKYGTTALGSKFGLAATNLIGIVDANSAAMLAAMDPTTGNVLETIHTGAADTADAVNSYVSGISPLTIDVGTCQALTQGLIYNTTANLVTTGAEIAAGADLSSITPHTAASTISGVVIGLPTVEINQYNNKNIKSIKLVTGAYDEATDMLDPDTANDDVANSGKEFIRIQKSGTSTMAILGGRLEIAPH